MFIAHAYAVWKGSRSICQVIRGEASKQFDDPVKKSQTSSGIAIAFLQFLVGVWF
jgi:hypothetical protein